MLENIKLSNSYISGYELERIAQSPDELSTMDRLCEAACCAYDAIRDLVCPTRRQAAKLLLKDLYQLDRDTKAGTPPSLDNILKLKQEIEELIGKDNASSLFKITLQDNGILFQFHPPYHNEAEEDGASIQYDANIKIPFTQFDGVNVKNHWDFIIDTNLMTLKQPVLPHIFVDSFYQEATNRACDAIMPSIKKGHEEQAKTLLTELYLQHIKAAGNNELVPFHEVAKIHTVLKNIMNEKALLGWSAFNITLDNAKNIVANINIESQGVKTELNIREYHGQINLTLQGTNFNQYENTIVTSRVIHSNQVHLTPSTFKDLRDQVALKEEHEKPNNLDYIDSDKADELVWRLNIGSFESLQELVNCTNEYNKLAEGYAELRMEEEKNGKTMLSIYIGKECKQQINVNDLIKK